MSLLPSQPPLNLQPVYNAAPTMSLPIVRQDAEGRRRLDLLRWGLVPFWAKDLKIGNQCINARVETVATKPAFREAFKRKRRVLVPAEGYYEWRTEAGKKQPYMITPADGGPVTFAGLWERWTPKETEPGHDATPVETFTIVTGPATPSAARVHDRMPAILRPDQFDAWLTAPADEALPLLAPYAGELTIVPVNTAMSNVRNQTADAAAPIGPPIQPPTMPIDTAMSTAFGTALERLDAAVVRPKLP